MFWYASGDIFHRLLLLYDLLLLLHAVSLISWEFLTPCPTKRSSGWDIASYCGNTAAGKAPLQSHFLLEWQQRFIFQNTPGKAGSRKCKTCYYYACRCSFDSLWAFRTWAVCCVFLGFGASILSGCLTLACMILPTIIASSEEALRAVPQLLRQGSLALGATKWQTIYKNVLPYSFSGMLTGSILGIGRAAGETAPILLTVAAFYLPDCRNRYLTRLWHFHTTFMFWQLSTRKLTR